MKGKFLLFLIFLIFNSIIISFSQNRDSTDCYLIAFYNTENLFDPRDDSLKNDEAFTPEGFNHWSFKKMKRKVSNIAKVLLAMGKGEPPDIIGLAEIENRFVLEQLCYHSPLKKFQYKIVHYDSPDMRGIEVALLYRSERIQIVYSEPIPVVFPFEIESKNRDILYVVATFPQGDSLHLFVNHWTSRYGGYAPTILKRNHYATIIRENVNLLLEQNPKCNILITGDFNDYPTDESISQVLGAVEFPNKEADLYNLMLPFFKQQNMGTHKREDFWGCLDQIIVSKALLEEDNRLLIVEREAHIFKSDFMMVPDEKYGGEKVFRTYLGPKYIGGYADHLPVYLFIRVIKR